MRSYRAIGEFSPRSPHKDEGEGSRLVFIVCEIKETHESVYEASNSTVHVGNSGTKAPLYEHSENSTKDSRRKK